MQLRVFVVILAVVSCSLASRCADCGNVDWRCAIRVDAYFSLSQYRTIFLVLCGRLVNASGEIAALYSRPAASQSEESDVCHFASCSAVIIYPFCVLGAVFWLYSYMLSDFMLRVHYPASRCRLHTSHLPSQTLAPRSNTTRPRTGRSTMLRPRFPSSRASHTCSSPPLARRPRALVWQQLACQDLSIKLPHPLRPPRPRPRRQRQQQHCLCAPTRRLLPKPVCAPSGGHRQVVRCDFRQTRALPCAARQLDRP